MSAAAILDAPSVTAWPQAKLADIADIVNGGTPKSNVAEFWNGEHQWLTPADMGKMVSREIAQTPRTITAMGLAKSSARLAPPRSVILSTRAPIGHLAVNAVPMAFNQGCRALVPGPKLDHVFLYYFLLHSRELLNELGTGTTFKELSATSLKTVQMPLPPLEEQKRIVSVLDQAFAALDRARALAEANLVDAEELFECQLTLEFVDAGDPKERFPFGQLCTALTPKTKIQRKEYLEAGAFPIVSQEADLVSGYWNDQSALVRLTKPVVVFGDHTRCLKYIDFDFVVGADGTKVLLPKSGIDPLYLYYGLRSVPLAEKGYARHFKFLKEVSLPKLELSEQGRVSLGLRSLEEEVTKLTAAYYDKLGELTDLRQSLLQKAFAGELA
ncbi:restriction endonuclease subunit S [Tsuneonella rigui]|uniref:restriction endonuclease subunit S n=1 Tax=Tsuneonella rigui TaxID=1708790 RepID=UPI000F7F74BD|nr:restriction endonuclease subunit S [Tsuneonella rigui]